MSISHDRTIDTTLLQTFLVVAEYGTLTQAATILNRTQSAISLRIHKLECELKVQLFERHSHGVSLTENGRKLHNVAVIYYDNIKEIRILFQNPSMKRIKIGIPADYHSTLLSPALNVLNAISTQDIKLEIHSGWSLHFPNDIRNKKIDLAVYACNPDHKDYIYSDPTVWVAHVDYTQPEGLPIPLVLPKYNCWWRKTALAVLGEKDIKYSLAYECDDYTSITAVINAKVAVGILGASTMDSNMKQVGEEYNLPELPASKLNLIKGGICDEDTLDNIERAFIKTMEQIGVST